MDGGDRGGGKRKRSGAKGKGKAKSLDNVSMTIWRVYFLHFLVSRPMSWESLEKILGGAVCYRGLSVLLTAVCLRRLVSFPIA